MDLRSRVAADFEDEAPLPRGLKGYVRRSEQIALADEIAHCMQDRDVLLAEAETGTGKTLAYLVPALRSDDKILISTHTRALQDQLVHRDLPAVQKVLGATRRVALLKGRANYLCPHRLQRHLGGGQLKMWELKPLQKIQQWALSSRDGDLSGLDFDVFARGIGPMVTATAEQCGGMKCPEFERCPLMKARQRAQAADIVVTNHSLLLADAALKSGEYGEVLPAFDCYIIDEAHALPELACQHFGIQMTRTRLIQWLNDVQALLDECGDEPALKQAMPEIGRGILDAFASRDLARLAERWDELLPHFEKRMERSEEFARIHERAVRIREEIAMVEQPPEGFVGWTEGEGEQLRHTVAPVETGPVLNSHLWSREASFVLLSATLRVSGSFAYARERLGLSQPREAYHPSPFNYREQALIYLPRHMPDRRDEADMEHLADEMETLIRASRGRAFVLFTSWMALNAVAPRLARRLPYTVLIQGESGSRDAILDAFRGDTHSVLCGTRSFWEGVDVPGDSLSLVIIDKMPFAPPGDPLLKARIRRCEEKGGNGFTDIQLPEAIATLRQGLGRLIRSSTDRGVMALLDSRLYQKRYGRDVVANLPPARIVDDLAEVRWFFEEHE